MTGKFLSQIFTHTPMTLVGLFLFLISFCGLVIWVYGRPGARKQYESMAQLPLDVE